MLSWKLTRDFDEETDQLFYNQVQTFYEIEGYMCECGHQEVVVKASYQTLNYSCPNCLNTHFYNADDARASFTQFLEDHDNAFYELMHNRDNKDRQPQLLYDYFIFGAFPIDYAYVVTYKYGSINASFQTIEKIPLAIDFSRQKIIAEPLELYGYMLHHSGEIREFLRITYNNKIFYKLQQKLNEYIRENAHRFNLPPLPINQTINCHLISFFLRYPHFKEFDFYFWDNVKPLPKEVGTISEALVYLLQGRNEKSVKKALFNNYRMQRETFNHFQSILITVICKTIQDHNHLVALLSNTLYCEGLTEEEAPFLERLILFLKKHYNEKQIVSFLKEIDDIDYVMDLLREFVYMDEEIEALFNKPKCTIEALHDEFSQCARYKHAKEAFYTISYHHHQENAEAKVLGYEVKLPYNGKELFEWSVHLHNCLSGYINQVHQNLTTIYGFFYQDNLEFAVEIVDKTINQARGKCNKELTPMQNEALKTWFHRYIKEGVNENVLDIKDNMN